MALVALYLPVTGRSILCSKKSCSQSSNYPCRSSRRVRKISASGPKRTSLQSAGKIHWQSYLPERWRDHLFLKLSALASLPLGNPVARLPKSTPDGLLRPELAACSQRFGHVQTGDDITQAWSCPTSKTSLYPQACEAKGWDKVILSQGPRVVQKGHPTQSS